ncbi:hypothetical protein [Ornithobacterium rhinotracheale]|uniref:hypothetical protein n=1 Tax=Ornithobacterium rhinotracheale TaxID=28251 RepID=UPI001FF12A56|nr:hypothetical protein [Ornithobacterium rhinotracheale]MCK0201349.1 hypothetical protein [Ornithobacterium rhinotracheale]
MFLQETTAPTVKHSSEVQREKLHKVTQMTAQDYKALNFKPQPVSKKHLRAQAQKAYHFIVEKGLLHEFTDFINSKTA